jgi:hypothetical protein
LAFALVCVGCKQSNRPQGQQTEQTANAAAGNAGKGLDRIADVTTRYCLFNRHAIRQGVRATIDVPTF